MEQKQERERNGMERDITIPNATCSALSSPIFSKTGTRATAVQCMWNGNFLLTPTVCASALITCTLCHIHCCHATLL